MDVLALELKHAQDPDKCMRDCWAYLRRCLELRSEAIRAEIAAMEQANRENPESWRQEINAQAGIHHQSRGP